MTPTQKGIAPHVIQLMTDSARKIMHEAREKAKAALTETDLLEQLITLELNAKDITVNAIKVHYVNSYEEGGWYMYGTFEIPPTLDDEEAIQAIEDSLPESCGVLSAAECKAAETYYEPYSRHNPRTWVYSRQSKAIQLRYELVNLY